jgi:hypothetical protein
LVEAPRNTTAHICLPNLSELDVTPTPEANHRGIVERGTFHRLRGSNITMYPLAPPSKQSFRAPINFGEIRPFT